MKAKSGELLVVSLNLSIYDEAHTLICTPLHSILPPCSRLRATFNKLGRVGISLCPGRRSQVCGLPARCPSSSFQRARYTAAMASLQPAEAGESLGQDSVGDPYEIGGL